MRHAAAALVLLTAALSVSATPMEWRGSRGWGPGGPYARHYDPHSVVTVRGEVLAVESFATTGMSPGVHVTLRAAQETLSVHLGPEWYISTQDTTIEPGDTIEVTGSRATVDGKPVVIAAEVVKGDQLLRLRDDRGFPAWAGWRHREPRG